MRRPDGRRPYEDALWETSELAAAVSELRHGIAALGCTDLADEIEGIASRPGPLLACMARSSTHVARHGETRPAGLARLAVWVARAAPRCSPEYVVVRIAPVLRWGFGFAGMSLGSLSVGPDTMGKLLQASDRVACDGVRAVWLAGLLELADLRSDSHEVVQHLVEAQSGAVETAVELAVHRAQSAFCAAEAELLGHAPDRVGTCRVWLNYWYNALAMARRCADANVREALVRLLRHLQVAPSGVPFSDENGRFRARAITLDRDCERFWRSTPRLRKPTTPLGAARVEFMCDPIEVLNVGNEFDTCLRLGGMSEPAVVGWALNASVRVVAVRAEDGTLLGRRTVGLSLQDAAGLSPYQSYPLGEATITSLTDEFIARLEHETGLARYDGATVENTWVPAYDDRPPIG